MNEIPAREHSLPLLRKMVGLPLPTSAESVAKFRKVIERSLKSKKVENHCIRAIRFWNNFPMGIGEATKLTVVKGIAQQVSERDYMTGYLWVHIHVLR